LIEVSSLSRLMMQAFDNDWTMKGE